MLATDKAFNRRTTASEGMFTIYGILFFNISDFCYSEYK